MGRIGGSRTAARQAERRRYERGTGDRRRRSNRPHAVTKHGTSLLAYPVPRSGADQRATTRPACASEMREDAVIVDAHGSRCELAEFERLVAGTERQLLRDALLLTGDVHEARDLVQEVYLRAWKSWSQVREVDEALAWCRRVLRNLAIGNWRRRRVALSYLQRQRPAASARTAEEEALFDPVWVALRALPPPQRQAVVLHHLFDLPIDEVAAQLRVPAGTVKSWLSRGRRALAIAIADDGPRPPVGPGPGPLKPADIEARLPERPGLEGGAR